MNREPHLESLLRTLKLPGMADMLGERLAQAKRIGFEPASLSGAPFGLVGSNDDRSG